VFINGLSGLWIQVIANLAGIFLINIPVFFFNKHRKYELSKWIFSIGLISLVLLVSLTNIFNQRHTSTEILILALASFVIIVFEGKGKNILFFICALSVLIIEYYKNLFLQSEGLNSSFYFSIVNYGIALTAVYFFSQIFKSELHRAVRRVELLNQDLARSELILYSLIDDSPMFMALLDAKGRYVMVNKKFVQGFNMSRSDIIGKHYREILSSDLIDFHEPLIHRSFGGEYLDFYQEMSEHPELYNHSYGKYFPVFNEKGDVQYVTVFVTDISDLKKVESKLQELNRTKDKLFSVLAHDIISPINLLRNTITLSEHQDTIGEVDLRAFLQRTKEQLLLLTHMMENLLKWGKSQFHGWSSSPQEVNPNNVIEEILTIYKDHSDGKNLRVNRSSNFDGNIQVDKGLFELILRNLIVNAFKFSEKGGEVKIFQDAKEGEFEFHVQDQGAGISQSLIDRISSGSSVESQIGTDGESGTGLGLQLCFEVARQEGWTLQIDSGSNKGAHFVLKIPK
tara:strand:- start:4461 stop:5993 length:1533 start_codon:yes stop_codon:yes gene_type:complete